jgi:hypothetical protein
VRPRRSRDRRARGRPDHPSDSLTPNATPTPRSAAQRGAAPQLPRTNDDRPPDGAPCSADGPALMVPLCSWCSWAPRPPRSTPSTRPLRGRTGTDLGDWQHWPFPAKRRSSEYVAVLIRTSRPPRTPRQTSCGPRAPDGHHPDVAAADPRERCRRRSCGVRRDKDKGDAGMRPTHDLRRRAGNRPIHQLTSGRPGGRATRAEIQACRPSNSRLVET